jgi:hypothetical protein
MLKNSGISKSRQPGFPMAPLPLILYFIGFPSITDSENQQPRHDLERLLSSAVSCRLASFRAGGQSAYSKSVKKFSSARFQNSASAGRVFPERDTVFFRKLFRGHPLAIEGHRSAIEACRGGAAHRFSSAYLLYT